MTRKGRLPAGRRPAFIRYTRKTGGRAACKAGNRWSVVAGLRNELAIHDNCANRMASRRRWIIQISAPSTFDGWIEANHGDHGWRRIGVRFRRGSLEKRLPLPRKAAGAQIAQSWHREAVTINNNAGLWQKGLQLEWAQFKSLSRGTTGGQVWCQQPR